VVFCRNENVARRTIMTGEVYENGRGVRESGSQEIRSRASHLARHAEDERYLYLLNRNSPRSILHGAEEPRCCCCTCECSSTFRATILLFGVV
jgi:hypothetical protein